MNGSIQLRGKATADWPSAADLLARQLAFDLDKMEGRMHATGGAFSAATRLILPYQNSMSGSPSNDKALTELAISNAIAAAIAGGVMKGFVDVATTANINLSSWPSTIDGVSLLPGMRVLVKNQTSSTENGVYTFALSGTTNNRADDLDTFDALAVTNLVVDRGTTNANTLWYCGAVTGGTLGSTAITYTQFTGGATYTADEDTLTLSGGIFSVKAGGVGTTELENGGVTLGKMANMATASLLGRNTAGTGTPEVLGASTVRSLLSLVPGTDVQAYNAVLAALAALTNNADKGVQFSGSGAASTFDLKFGTEAAYTGTVTWTAGANPSGSSSLRQFYTHIGNLVSWTIVLTYATAGTTVTGLSLTFPTEFPTPHIPNGFTGADVRIWNCNVTRMLPTPTSGSLTATSAFFISRNSANNGFVIAPTGTFASSTVRQVTLSGIYFTS